MGEKVRRGTYQGKENKTEGKFWFFIVGLSK